MQGVLNNEEISGQKAQERVGCQRPRVGSKKHAPVEAGVRPARPQYCLPRPVGRDRCWQAERTSST